MPIKQPAQFTRRILLAVTGRSPQIVTETLYALAVQQKPAFAPTEIHVISTSEGLDRARLTLLDPDQGQYHSLLRDYDLDPANIHFDEDCLHVIRDSEGQPLSDIVDKAANDAAADLILETVRKFCAVDDLAMHASIAGGRKTMGYYLGYAMSLLGRHQDRLSHVLVNAPFESSREFFYPPVKPRLITVRDQPVHTRDARIMLADIPFVRMASKTAIEKLRSGAGYVETVDQIQGALDEPALLLDLDAGKITAHGKSFRLPPIATGILTYFATRVLLERSRVSLAGHQQAVLRQMLPIFEQAEVSNLSSIEALLCKEESIEVSEEISAKLTLWLSRLHKGLNKQLGPVSERYKIRKTRTYDEDGRARDYRYSLPLQARQIEIKCDSFAQTLQAVKANLEPRADPNA